MFARLYDRFNARARRRDALGWTMAGMFVVALAALGTAVFTIVATGHAIPAIIGLFLLLVLLGR